MAGTGSARRSRLIRCAAAATVSCMTTLVAGCDPSPPSSDVILARSVDGRLYVIGTVCHARLVAVEFGEGTNMDARSADVTVLALGGVVGWFQFRIDDPEASGYTVADNSRMRPVDLGPPFYVRLRAPGGYWGRQVFTTLPSPGMALFQPFGDGATGPHEVPLTAVPSALDTCPTSTRTFEPAAG